MLKYVKYLYFIIFFYSPALDAYEFVGASWPMESGAVAYALAPNGSDDVKDGSDLDAVRRAFQTWACATGSGLRFYEALESGPAALNLDDDVNTVFWVESEREARAAGLGPGTLGITLGDVPTENEETIQRQAADIVFNGFDHTWSVSGDQTDVESIALHEVGHFIGLDHPCEDPEETDCLPPTESVLSPFYGGGEVHVLGDDDEQAVQSIYPLTNDSDCQGPYQLNESCIGSCECLDDLICAEHYDGLRCTATCSNKDVSCPDGFICELSVPDPTSGNSRGLCRRHLNKDPLSAGQICETGGQCQTNTCALISEIGRQVCVEECLNSGSCNDDRFCFNGQCLMKNQNNSIACEAPDASAGCKCNQRKENHAGFLTFLMIFLSLQRRRRFF